MRSAHVARLRAGTVVIRLYPALRRAGTEFHQSPPMFAATLITLRETLEASLVVGVVLAFLHKVGNRKLDIAVWMGVLGGIVVSVAIALVLQFTLGDFTGRAEEIYEGMTMLIAAGLLTWMIVWMLQQRRSIRRDIESKVSMHMEDNHPLGIFLLVLVSTAREGVETVIFLKALIVHSEVGYHLFGGVLGIVIAVALSYFLFRGIEVLPLKKVFSISSVLLTLFAAGLVAHGLHEFQEAGFLPFLSSTLWDLNPVVVTEGSYPLLHESGAIGSVLKGVFGYNGDPTGIEVLGYVLYIFGIAYLWKKMTVSRQ